MGEIAAHASVVERELHVGGRPLRTGYVEAVATAPLRQGEGLGSLVMAEVSAYIRDGVRAGCARHRAASLLRAAGLADLGRAIRRANG